MEKFEQPKERQETRLEQFEHEATLKYYEYLLNLTKVTPQNFSKNDVRRLRDDRYTKSS